MIEEVRRLAQIEDHATRARQAVEMQAQLQEAIKETARIRRESIQWLRDHDHSLADVARILGVSRARVAQLKETGPPPETIFLGAGTITVAVPERSGGRRLVARADAETGQTILGLAHELGLAGQLEYIPISGEIDLDRENLMVVCGPKSSPVTAQILQADPMLDFDQAADGRWAITEKLTGVVHVSPMDDPVKPAATDIAFLGRLPRPDGNGTFLYIAGVHAIGSLGAAHFLQGHLAEIYDEVGTELFSMVISSDHDTSTEAITESRSLTAPLRRQDQGPA